MNRHIELISILLVTASALFSCTGRGLDPASSDEGEFVDYGFYMSGTKGDEPEKLITTYRAMLHSYGTAGQYPYTGYSGTYRATESSEKAWLLPCVVDPSTGNANPATGEENHAAGLRAPRGKYYISFVSPAVAPENYTGTEWGLHLYRVGTLGRPNTFISSPVLIDSLKGNRLANQAVYDFKADTLKLMRSVIDLKIKCGDLDSIRVMKVGLTNRYDEGYYNLRLDELDALALSSPGDTSWISVDLPKTLKTGTGSSLDAETSHMQFNLLPVDYSKKTGGNLYVYELPEIEIQLSDKLLKVKLDRKIERSKTYHCTITINSANVGVDVTVDVSDGAWNDRTVVSGEPIV